MSLEQQVEKLISQTQQLDTTVKTELADTNSDVSKLRGRVTALEIQMGLPGNGKGIPGGGGDAPNYPVQVPGNDVIKIDEDNKLVWLWNPDQGAWVSIPFTTIAPPVDLDVGAIIDQANDAIDAGLQQKVDNLADLIKGTILDDYEVAFDGFAGRLDMLTAKTDELKSFLTTEQTVRADKDKVLSDQTTTLAARVDQNHQAFLAFQAQVVTDPDGAAAEYLQSLASKVDQNIANLNTEIATRATADESAAKQLSTLSTSVGAAQAAVAAEVQARTSADNALTTMVNSLASRMGSAESAISSVQKVTAGLDSSIAQSVTTLTSKVGQLTTTVQDTAVALDGIEGRRALAINANGQVTGIELLGGGAAGSQIKFQTGSFIVYDPSTNVETVPFVINGGISYLKKAMIKEADIDTLKIAGNSVTVPKVVTRYDGVYATGNMDLTTPSSVISSTITLPYGGLLVYQFGATLGYQGWDDKHDPNYKGRIRTYYSIRINGVEKLLAVAGTVETFPTLMGSEIVGAGTYTVEVYWKGDRWDTNSWVCLQTRSLLLLGAMR